MTIKFVLPALLVLCGAAHVFPVHAAEYRCMVFSGAEGRKPEASTNKDGKYAIKAADLESAQANALATAKRYKKDVTLTKAQCEEVTTGSTTAATPPEASPPAVPTPAPAAAPTNGSATVFCAVYEGSEFLDPPAAYRQEANIWKVTASSTQPSDDVAIALAKAQGMNADHAECAGSVERLKSH